MFNKRILNEFKKYNELPEDDDKKLKIKIKLNESNIKEVYFVICNLDDPYTGGYYFGKIELPDNYPHSPPGFMFYTPNGRFAHNGKICTTFSDFHKESWSAAWHLIDMLYGLITMMYESAHGKEGGIGGIETSPKERLTLAKESMMYNIKKIPNFKTYFPELIDNQKH